MFNVQGKMRWAQGDGDASGIRVRVRSKQMWHSLQTVLSFPLTPGPRAQNLEETLDFDARLKP